VNVDAVVSGHGRTRTYGSAHVARSTGVPPSTAKVVRATPPPTSEAGTSIVPTPGSGSPDVAVPPIVPTVGAVTSSSVTRDLKRIELAGGEENAGQLAFWQRAKSRSESSGGSARSRATRLAGASGVEGSLVHCPTVACPLRQGCSLGILWLGRPPFGQSQRCLPLRRPA